MQQTLADNSRIILIGNPNVGKSALFGRLTDQYVTVSNYSGTTVTLTQGRMKTGSNELLVMDTPGTNNFLPNSEDEMVTRNILLELEKNDSVLQVIDTKNIKRGLFLTIQLSEMGVCGAIALNMWDEAKRLGHKIDIQQLATMFQVPFIPTVAVYNRGIRELKKHRHRQFCHSLQYPEQIEIALAEMEPLLPSMAISYRALGLMALSKDPSFRLLLAKQISDLQLEKIDAIVTKTEANLDINLRMLIDNTRMAAAEKIEQQVVRKSSKMQSRWLWEQLERLSTHSIAGFAILLCVLYAIYQFVGVLGAGILVDFFENTLFNEFINPFAIKIVDFCCPFPHQHIIEDNMITTAYQVTSNLSHGEQILRFIHDFFVGTYGVFTMALTYGFAIILPVVFTFFLAFGFLEDLGYLSRLSILLNRVFKFMGLNGKAVLPMILGLGCDTMATVSARILDTHKERVIVTFLLALAVPCSAQLAIIMFLLERSGLGMQGILLWAAIVGFVLLLAGYAASKVVAGDDTLLIIEIPPLRFPMLRNILQKTLARLEWYLKEVIPVFLLGSAILFLLHELGCLQKLERLLSPIVVSWLGLPQQAAQAILMGFFRRDYGVAGFILMAEQGLLSKAQILIGVTTVTLFVPCIANALVIIKERGLKLGIYISIIVLFIAFTTGGILFRVLRYFPGYW